MIDDFLASLVRETDVTLRSPVDTGELAQFETDQGVALPATHRQLLLRTNGLEVYQGHMRIYGLGANAAIDMRTWNDQETWKFAWPPELLRDYLFVAENAWGHQCAYRATELRQGGDPPLHMVLQISNLQKVFTFPSFQAFLENPIFRGVVLQDSLNRALHARFGSIASNRHLRHKAFGLSGSSENASQIIETDSVESMIFWGDMTKALDGQPPLRRTKQLEYFPDERGRRRVRVVWQDETP